MKKNLQQLLIRICLCAMVILLFTTCSKDHLFDCTMSSGNTITQMRQPASITAINLSNDVDVIVHFGTEHFIKVTAGEHLADGIITEVSGATLYIRNENRCNWVRSFKNKYTVELCIDSLTDIESYGSGNITCADTIRSYDFTFNSWNSSGSAFLLLNNYRSHLNNNTGRADIHAVGISSVAFSYINDVAILDAAQLKTELCYFRSNSTGDCHLNSSVGIYADIQYTGDVYYSGDAQAARTGSGSGRLIHE